MIPSTLLTLQLALAAVEPLPLPAVLIDLGPQPAAQVDAYARSVEASGGWWLELDRQMLVAAPADRLPGLLRGQRVEAELGEILPESLALQSRACTVNEAYKLPALVEAGRFALVRAPRRFVSYAVPDSLDWRAVVPNQVLVRDLGARGPLARAKAADAALQRRVDAVDPARWFGNVQALAGFDRSSYSPGLDLARDWLGAQFQGMGLAVEYHTFSFSHSSGSATIENVIATLPGARFPDELIVVGGHYDSRTVNIQQQTATPGAEDNASGCSGVLEMAQVFSRHRPDRTMLFMCFGGEEQNLYGSAAYVQKLQSEGRLGRVQLALIMDMIGYSGDADLDVLLESSAAHASWFARFAAQAATYAPELRIVTSTQPFGSDHVPFLNAGAPALLTIENDWNSYPHYHRSTDIPANMTRAQPMAGAILKMNAALLAEAAGMSDQGFADGFE